MSENYWSYSFHGESASGEVELTLELRVSTKEQADKLEELWKTWTTQFTDELEKL